MRTTRNFVLPVALLLSTVGAFAAAAMTDEEITAEVKRVLTTDNETKGNRIEVQTRDGVVQLSGFIESGRVKAAAASAARSVSGVRQVRDDLIVREGDRTLEQGGQDSIIAAKVKSSLDERSHESDQVNVNVRGGIVQLTGFVATQDRKVRAERMARSIEGVTDVRNDIEVSSER
jgi:hyperosmotically inducible periplasmic protein